MVLYLLLTNIQEPDNCKNKIALVLLTQMSQIAVQLLLKSQTLFFSEGSLIFDSRDEATGLLVITSG
jgi:hypothetical protein